MEFFTGLRERLIIKESRSLATRAQSGSTVLTNEGYGPIGWATSKSAKQITDLSITEQTWRLI